jgi:tetratricopeptide (TPR) repeat protein
MNKPIRIIFFSALPKGHDYLPQVNEEINSIRDGIFKASDPLEQDFKTDVYQYIEKDHFAEIISRDQPDIIHFTGHGTIDGLVFQYEEEVSGKTLRELLEKQKNPVQLVFLNACYSADQFSELKNLEGTCLIGNDEEISEDIATDFACIFYRNYKRIKNIPEAYSEAEKDYKFKNPSKGNTMQVFHPQDQIQKPTETPIEKTIKENQIKVIQSKKIPSDLLSKIQNTIRVFEEDIMISEDPLRFKAEMKNVSEILSMLRVHVLEYAINIEWKELRDQNRVVTQIIKELDDPLLPRKKLTTMKYLKQTYTEIIVNIFKKIYFDLVIDSIEKLPPLLPEDTEYEYFGAAIGLMYSMLKGLNLIREKINQSFSASNKFYEYLINRCSDLFTFIKLDFEDLKRLSIGQLQTESYKINFYDDPNVTNQLDNFHDQVKKTQKQKSKSSRIINLEECLENVANIEEALMNLFRKIILIGLEYNRKNSHSNIVPNLSKAENAEALEIDTKKSNKEFEALEREIMERMDNAKFTEPQELLLTITELTSTIAEKHVQCSVDESFLDELHSCYGKMYRELDAIRDDISGNFEKIEKFPYLFPEITDLCNFWKFRFNALERKQARKYLTKINHYFSNLMYKEISESSQMKGNRNNIKLMNIKLLNKIGVANMYLEKYHEAKDNFNEILELDKSNTDALFNLGLTYQEIESKDPNKNFTKSIQQFKKIEHIDPNNVNALTSLGILHFKMRKYPEASDYIKRSISASDHEDWRALLAMGSILSDGQQDYSAAKDYFDRCEKLNVNSTLVKLNICQNLIFLEQYHVAEKKLQTEILEKIALIEDRSTKIIAMVMLICLRYLNKDKTNSDNEIRELLRLFDLKDSKLIDWNFQNLKRIVENSKVIKDDDREFLKNMLCLPGNKPENEKLIKKKIHDFVINKLDLRNVEYIPDDDERIKVKVELKKLGKSELDEIEWVLWNISLKISSKYYINDKSVAYVVYKFDPTFQDKRENKTLYPDIGKEDFSINVIGWEATKFEIELSLKNGSIQKMVSNLKL